MLRPYNRPGQWELLVGGGEGFVGGTEEGGGFVEDDGDGDVAEEAFEFPLVLEGVEENSVFHFFENFDGDAAGDVDAAERQNFQREISGFGAIDGGPKIQGVGTHAAGLIQTTAGDLRGGIRIGIFKRRVYNFRREEFVNGAEAATGENEFPAYLRIAAAHEAQQFDLLLDVRDTQLFDEASGVDDPWKICRSHGAVDHRPGNAEAGGDDAFLSEMIGGLA